MFGQHAPVPTLWTAPHHYVHAFQAFRQSQFERALCLTLDGSGDTECTVLWRCEGHEIEPLYRFNMPNSLGWFYAAFTEYLGFEAYDGEYKVMGLAAYGRPDPNLTHLVSKVLSVDAAGSYNLDSAFIHYGTRSFSARFTDDLPKLLGRPPRLGADPIEPWHEDLAYAVQCALEEAASAVVRRGIQETGINNVCIGGGVGLNVKMNSALFALPEVADLFAHPLCSDSGAAAGAALAASFELTGAKPEKITTLSLGHKEETSSAVTTLTNAKVEFHRARDVEQETARLLARGAIVGWFQGAMEAGPRALGNRSILADPRSIENRDKVNSIIKFREYWRPFCPSMPAEELKTYFERYTFAPFMIIAFKANEKLAKAAPAIVHVDGTCRVQGVEKDANPRYYKLLKAFGALTGVPVLLNTSFNVKGEPIVCTATDALRTFWATGLDALVIEDCVVLKPWLKEALEAERAASLEVA